MAFGIDRGRPRGGPVVMGLALLAAVQIGVIVVALDGRNRVPAPRPPDLLIGEAITAISARDSLAGVLHLQLKAPGWTVILAFSPTCAWCDSVAPRWKQWTQRRSGAVRMVGISSGSPSASLRYAHAHGWRFGSLLMVDSGVTGVLGRQLTRKTPWLFLLDSTGVLRYSGHGNEVGVVDSLIGISK